MDLSGNHISANMNFLLTKSIFIYRLQDEELNLFTKKKAAVTAAQASAQQATAQVAKEQLKSKKK